MNGQRAVRGVDEHEWKHPARKHARVASDDEGELESARKIRPLSGHGHDHADKDKDKSITIASVAKHLPQTVAPFLAKHIPSQYAPLGDPSEKRRVADTSKDPNSKFCYRHRPDMLCRRQADEPTMDKLQKNLEAMTPEDQQGIVQVWSLFSVAPSKHRNLMLQGILAQCCFPQLSFLSTNVRELIRIDFLAALPSEVAFRILCFLDTTSLCKAAQVSRKWRQLADDDVVWHRMCEQHIDRKCTKCGWGLPMLERKRLRASKRLIQLRASGQGVDDSSGLPGDHVEAQINTQREQSTIAETEQNVNGQVSPASVRRPLLPGPTQSEFERITRPWKDVYKDRFKVGTNWKHGRGKLEILRGHSNGVMAMHMYDHILATGSYDDTIKIWDLDTCKELRTLKGHTMGIRCLQLDESKLISGSLDKTLKVWNWRTGECVATYTGHQEGVVGLHFDANILVSGSIDKTARIWNFQDRTAFNLRGHNDWVNSVRIDTTSRTVFTASDDCTIKMWDLDTRRCLFTYEGHVGQVQQVLLLPSEFDADEEAGDSGNHTSDPGSPDSAFTSGSSYRGHGDQPSPVLLHRNLPSDARSTAYETPLIDPFADFPIDRPRPPRYILTSALDSTIRLWEVSTGRCVRTFFGHLEGVWAVAADTLRLVSGAEDRTVKVWDPRTGKCDRTYTGHRGPVTCIALSDSRMVSAGEDGEVRVYSFSD